MRDLVYPLSARNELKDIALATGQAGGILMPTQEFTDGASVKQMSQLFVADIVDCTDELRVLSMMLLRLGFVVAADFVLRSLA